jgi:hypothetical protein
MGFYRSLRLFKNLCQFSDIVFVVPSPVVSSGSVLIWHSVEQSGFLNVTFPFENSSPAMFCILSSL